MRRTAAAAAVGVLLFLTSTAAEENNEKDDGGSGDAKFFVKSYSTTTWTFLSSFTSTVPYTCYTTGAGLAACSGRRLHRMKNAKLYLSSQDDLKELDSSVLGDFDEREKFFFTVWRTASTTATVTTYSTNRSVTISASIACTYPGIVYNNC
ncbi:uncharacterized protein [Procambarus clarkii]|uniref:uncharacterized protein n=1 Tax=Procambarus clarkii TaxID=6728 RepID=UPI001E673E2E|nr:uncharacterized protein LOC123773651 [Procambarus clarkii]